MLSNCLATTNPNLAKEWHPTKNAKLLPYNVTAGSSIKVWWQCTRGDDHQWQATIVSRANGNGCPICRNLLIVLSNCLATTNQNLAQEWHPTMNGKLTPYNVSAGSNKKIWWQCPKGGDHEWQATVASRTIGNGCPVCSGYFVVHSNCLAITNPKLAQEWHPTKNAKLTPYNVRSGGSTKVWWKCSKGDDHEWQAAIYDRKSQNCSVCAGKKIVLSTCLATTNPDLAQEWHPTKNGKLTPYNVTAGSNKKVWWQCSKNKDHEWDVKIKLRKKYGCAVCSNKKVLPSNCLTLIYPNLAQEWHPTKNGTLTPDKVHHGSHQKAWWKCPKNNDHEWQAVVRERKKNGCPKCRVTFVKGS